MSLFDHPVLYNALRTPDHESVERVRAMVHEHLGRPPASVMDPACGPGTWLEPFETNATFLAGNDLSASMVADCRRRYAHRACEFVQGDMCDLRFGSGPFDLSLEVSGTACLLDTPEQLARFLRGMARCTRRGGLVLAALFFESPDEPFDAPLQFPRLLWNAGPCPAGAGEAWVRYELIGRDSHRRLDHLRRTVRSAGVPGAPSEIRDEYSLRVWTDAELREVLAGVPELELVDRRGLDHVAAGQQSHATASDEEQILAWRVR